MAKTKNLKTVAIVGRPNVGKSALFNRLAGKDIAIVHDMPGVTRDRIIAECRRTRPNFTIVDTGGIGEILDDNLHARVRAEAEIAIESCDVILFVVDGRAGLTSVDEELAVLLRRHHRPVILVVNKIDGPKQDMLDSEFSRLGFDGQIRVSAEHGRGLQELLQRTTAILKTIGPAADHHDTEEDEIEAEKDVAFPLKVAILGRPNVGKSSLVNAILDSERTIVSAIAGTTRDSVDVPFETEGRRYMLIDTAGIRRQASIQDEVEYYSVKRARHCIRRSDICALMIDVSTGVTAQDRKIAQLIVKEDKPCIVIANKFDLYHTGVKLKDRLAVLHEEVQRELVFLDYAPIVIISAKERQYLDKIFRAIDRVRVASEQSIPTGPLNRLLHTALQTTPPTMHGGRRFKLLYATRTQPEKPTPIEPPHFILFGNRVELLDQNYLRYLENRVRDENPFTGLPIKFSIRGKEVKERQPQ